MNEVKLVVDAKAQIGEGPFWDSKKGLLYWVDILGKKLHSHNPLDGTNGFIQLEQYVGAAAGCSSGGIVLALHNGFFMLDLESGQVTELAAVENRIPTNRFNDGKCDAAGRFWAGTMEMDGEHGKGTLYCIDADHQVKAMLPNLSISNGIAWNSDNTTMYFIDSSTRQVVAFDYDLSNGSISRKRTIVQIPEGEGLPDGMTIDVEGMLWVAQWGGSCVSRFNPHSGERLLVVRLPVSQVASCAFGGEELDILYITTARNGLSAAELENEPLAGGLFSIKTEVKGLPMFEYGG